jgi:hypothetical protein
MLPILPLSNTTQKSSVHILVYKIGLRNNTWSNVLNPKLSPATLTFIFLHDLKKMEVTQYNHAPNHTKNVALLHTYSIPSMMSLLHVQPLWCHMPIMSSLCMKTTFLCTQLNLASGAHKVFSGCTTILKTHNQNHKVNITGKITTFILMHNYKYWLSTPHIHVKAT